MSDTVKDFIRRYLGRIAGSALGLVVAVLFLTLGFFRTLLIIICMAIGFGLGMFRDSKEEFLEFMERILPKGIK